MKTSRAVAVWNQYQAMLSCKLAKYPLWQLRATTAMPFWMPTDPVLVMEGARMEPARQTVLARTLQCGSALN